VPVQTDLRGVTIAIRNAVRLIIILLGLGLWYRRWLRRAMHSAVARKNSTYCLGLQIMQIVEECTTLLTRGYVHYWKRKEGW